MYENNLVSVDIQDINQEVNENPSNPAPNDNQNDAQNTFQGDDTENNNNIATVRSYRV